MSSTDISNSDDSNQVDLSYHINKDFTNELKQATFFTLSVSDARFIHEFLNISNNSTKLCRILNYVFRFHRNVTNSKEFQLGNLTKDELKHASNVLVWWVQINEFSEDMFGEKKMLRIVS